MYVSEKINVGKLHPWYFYGWIQLLPFSICISILLVANSTSPRPSNVDVSLERSKPVLAAEGCHKELVSDGCDACIDFVFVTRPGQNVDELETRRDQHPKLE